MGFAALEAWHGCPTSSPSTAEATGLLQKTFKMDLSDPGRGNVMSRVGIRSLPRCVPSALPTKDGAVATAPALIL